VSGRIADHIRSNVVGYIALFCFAMGGTTYAATGGNLVLGAKNSATTPTSLTAPVAGKALQITNTSTGGGATALGLSVASGKPPFTVNSAAKVTNLNADQLDGIDSTGLWKATGNSGTTASSFLGTKDNKPLNVRVNNARALRLEPASDGTNQSPNVIGGIADNTVTPGVHSAVIAGGGRGVPSNPATANRVTDHQGTVGGGANNQAGDGAGTVGDRTLATVAGGGNNTASGELATVGGGFFNTASGTRATVGGGEANTASGDWSTVGAGNHNTAIGTRATVPGGFFSTAQGDFSFAAGRQAKANDQGAFVWADSSTFDFASTAQDQFNVRSTGGARLVSGIDGSGSPTSGLELPAGTSGWSTLVNGQPFDIRVNGARALRIDPASDGTNQSPNVIAGIADNTVTPGVHAATIAGGGRSVPANAATANRVTDDGGTIGGGANNQAGDGAAPVDDGTFATVGGGRSNRAQAFGATVSGGIANTASGTKATMAGGVNNFAVGNEATVSGGGFNTANGTDATVVGGHSNVAQGSTSLAGGLNALANHDGAFVWADSNAFNFASTAANEFSVRSTGGVRFVTGIDPSTGAPTAGVTLGAGSGTWSSLSDRASKRGIKRVSGQRVLRKLASVPVSTWSYRAQDPSIRHIGPMAQDFYRAFGVGEDRRHIDSVDADGVALAAIKGLSRELRAERRRTARLRARVAALEDR